MTLRPRNFLFLSAMITSSLTVAVACSSDESGSSDTGTPTSGTPTSGSTTSSTTGSTTSNTVATSAASNTTTSTTSAAAVTTTNTTGTSTVGGPSTTTSTSGSVTGTGTGTGAGGSTGAGGTSSGAGGTTSTTGGSTEFAITSPAFADDGVCSDDTPDTCELFPTANSSFADNESPELNWTAGPEGTLSYAVVFHDTSNGFGHWAIWGLSTETLSLPAALPGDATLTTPVEAQQTNASFAPENGYYGPGSCENVYEFKVYALNVASYTPADDTSPDTIQDELEDSDIVLDTATLRGRANPEDSTNPCN